MSRKIGMGPFSVEPTVFCGRVWDESEPESVNKMGIQWARMQTDCSATRDSPRRPSVENCHPPRRSGDKLFLGVLERVSARFIPRHEPRVVFEQILQMLSVSRKRFAAVWISPHVAKRQRLHPVSAVSVEVHVFLVATSSKEIIPYPTLQESRQRSRIKIERELINRSEDGKLVIARI